MPSPPYRVFVVVSQLCTSFMLNEDAAALQAPSRADTKGIFCPSFRENVRSPRPAEVV